MKAINPLKLTDGYKLGHPDQYPPKTEYVFANGTCRSDKHFIEANGEHVVFGMQYVCKFLKLTWDTGFFLKSKSEVINDFTEFISYYLNTDGKNGSLKRRVEALHDLGYLPIEIKSLPEGTMCPIGTPNFTIINTHPDFYWLTNFLETIISNKIWLCLNNATKSRLYLKRLMEHAEKTGFLNIDLIRFLCHDFSMRGMGDTDAAISSGMAHLTSFTGSESLPAIDMVQFYYNCSMANEVIGGTIPATEHAVMCAGGFDDEFDTFKRLITETYPSGYVSIVSDTWDLWTVVSDYLPRLKETIMERDGRVVIRPDSGDPVDIICGLNTRTGCWLKEENGKYYHSENGFLGDVSQYEVSECEYKGLYQMLWEIFGGTENEKGYKVLCDKIGAIYGDSINLKRQDQIYIRLENKGFAATNLVLGVGSFSYQFVSRDGLGFAIKSTWCQIDGQAKDIFKDPKTVTGMPKKSLKGLISVYKDEKGKYYAVDQIHYDKWVNDDKNELKTVFKNSEIIREVSLGEIRQNILNTL